ncbi:DUF362 domain-containing protein [Natronolimnohabitans innermongolicus]|uniref:DUF362 domain-containing protein n=1 Tax=Natronolimnohabitans innermongolicus JCM 12255 TaxID=1227499 RepID=L9WHM6_9EURY|nr:DUF362 domain-containing protein [Natronolimnohabitans innermongolicus]ELY48944.1 hypothetical protein C493_21146 [Natronolimnohabitans innermongolicus JCM 12255]
MSVHLAGVETPNRQGGWAPDVDRRLATLESPIRSVLEGHASSLTAGDRITLVPDTHYPFHPSSGMVTDPAVVGSIADRLSDWTDAEIGIAGATDDRIAFDRTAEYLGYPAIADRFDADLVDLADDDHRDTVVTVGDERVSIAVPERLLESTVVLVPTLRPTEDGPVSGGLRTLGRLVGSVADADDAAVAAERAVKPDLSVLDATIAYGGDPVAADALFAGPAAQIDAVGSSLLSRAVEEDPVLRRTVEAAEESVTVESVTDEPAVDLASLRRRIPEGGLPPRDEVNPLVTTAYRVYAAVAGDAVPPQFTQRR